MMAPLLDVVVHFRRLTRPHEDEFCLQLSKQHSYDKLVEKVSEQLSLGESCKIRFTSHNCDSGRPMPRPIEYHGVENLNDMLLHGNQTSDILYFEKVYFPIRTQDFKTMKFPLQNGKELLFFKSEVQGFRTLKVAFHNSNTEELSMHKIKLPKQSTVADVVNELRGGVELSCPKAELRILEVFDHKIFKIFPSNEKIEHINDHYWRLRAEEIPEEEKELGSQDRLIHVYHFTRTASQDCTLKIFGEPFLLLVRMSETLSAVKVRIKRKLQIADEEYAKWKFAFVPLKLGSPEYIQDTDILSSRFQKKTYGCWEHYLGLEHTDSEKPERTHQDLEEGRKATRRVLIGVEDSSFSLFKQGTEDEKHKKKDQAKVMEFAKQVSLNRRAEFERSRGSPSTESRARNAETNAQNAKFNVKALCEELKQENSYLNNKVREMELEKQEKEKEQEVIEQLCEEVRDDRTEEIKQLREEVRDNRTEFEMSSFQTKAQLQKMEQDLENEKAIRNAVLEDNNHLLSKLEEVEAVLADERKNRRHWAELMQQKELLDTKVRKLEKDIEMEQEKWTCRICFVKSRNAVCLPCMHFLFCAQCLRTHMEANGHYFAKKCPVCQVGITGILECHLDI